MSGSACAFGCGEEAGVHPDGERLSGFVGGGLHGVAFGPGGADTQDLAARVVEGRSAASFRLTHAAENIRPRKVLTRAGFMGHNNGMTTTRTDLGNNESMSRGIVRTSGGFLALTFAASKQFKTEAGAVAWLARRGVNADGTRSE